MAAGCRTSKKPGMRSKKKEYKRSVKTGRRARDLDQIQDNLIASSTKAGSEQQGADELGKIEYDDELPGCGQFYAWQTDKHFISEKALGDHKATREYKRRCKQIKEEKYDQAAAEWAGGMTKEVLPPAHPEMKKKVHAAKS